MRATFIMRKEMVKVVFIISKVGKTKATGITIDYLENMTSFIILFAGIKHKINVLKIF